MRLEDLVPPLELCKKIPAGKFADSALVYVIRLKDDPEVWERAKAQNLPPTWTKCPAPTAAEILECLTANWLDVPAIQYDGVLWKAFYTYHNSGNPMTPQTGTTATTAALRLWLEVEGVKDE